MLRKNRLVMWQKKKFTNIFWKRKQISQTAANIWSRWLGYQVDPKQGNKAENRKLWFQFHCGARQEGSVTQFHSHTEMMQLHNIPVKTYSRKKVSSSTHSMPIYWPLVNGAIYINPFFTNNESKNSLTTSCCFSSFCLRSFSKASSSTRKTIKSEWLPIFFFFCISLRYR